MAYTVQYYDLLLLAIAGAMGSGTVVGLFTAVSVQTAVIAAGVVGAALVGHGLFVNGPVDEPADLTDEVEAEELGMPIDGFPVAD